MPIKDQSYTSLNDLLNNMSHDETNPPIFILPSLETKKEVVEEMARQFGSVPDQNILRLGEFFMRQVQDLAPEVQFLDKDLLGLLLKSELRKNVSLEKHTPFLDVALDYISIFSPILGRDIYRQAFEDLIQEDEYFLKNYGDIYHFLSQLWDHLLASHRILAEWSLGWLYKNLELLAQEKRTLYIFGYHKIKNIEKDLFEELSLSWDIINVSFDENINKYKENKNFICDVVSPMDEVEFCIDHLQAAALDGLEVNIIAPKSKWFYKEILEVFFEKENLSPLPESEESLRQKIQSFLSPLKITSGDFDQSDLSQVLINIKNKFKDHKDFQKNTGNLLEIEALEFMQEQSSKTHISEKPIHFLSFLNLLLKSHSGQKDYEEVLRKIYSIAVQTPKNLKLSYKDWLSFVEIKLSRISPQLKSKHFNFYLLEDMVWKPESTNIFLSCTRNDYEKTVFAYLSDYEIDKIKKDLGFDLQGLSFKETFEQEFELNQQKSMMNYFLVPEFDFMGASQQAPQFIQQMASDPATQSLSIKNEKSIQIKNLLDERNLCSVKNFELKKLSASALQMYIDKPYEYFMSYVLGQKAEEALDIDPSALLRGNVFHKLLEVAASQDRVDFEFLQKLVKEEVKSAYKFWVNTESIELQIEKYINDILKYLDNDEQRKKASGRKTIFTEKKFAAHFNIKSRKFYKEPISEADVIFTGVIDRIDVINGRAYIVDYKSSKNSIRNLFSQPQVQMPLYAMMIKDKIIDCPCEELAGLVYIAIRNEFEEIPALAVNSYAEEFFDRKFTKSNKTVVDVSVFEEVIEEYRSFIAHQVEELKKGQFGSWIKNESIELIEVDF